MPIAFPNTIGWGLLTPIEIEPYFFEQEIALAFSLGCPYCPRSTSTSGDMGLPEERRKETTCPVW